MLTLSYRPPCRNSCWSSDGRSLPAPRLPGCGRRECASIACKRFRELPANCGNEQRCSTYPEPSSFPHRKAFCQQGQRTGRVGCGLYTRRQDHEHVPIRAAIGSYTVERVNLSSQIGQKPYVAQNAPNVLGPANGATPLRMHTSSLGSGLRPRIPQHGRWATTKVIVYGDTEDAFRKVRTMLQRKVWSGRLDSNQRPPAPKAGALPGCATPRLSSIIATVPDWLRNFGSATHCSRSSSRRRSTSVCTV